MKWSKEYQIIGRLWIGSMLETKCNKCLQLSELEKIHCGKEPQLRNYLEIVFIDTIYSECYFFSCQSFLQVWGYYNLYEMLFFAKRVFKKSNIKKTTNQNCKSGSHSFNQTLAASNNFVSAEGSNIHIIWTKNKQHVEIMLLGILIFRSNQESILTAYFTWNIYQITNLATSKLDPIHGGCGIAGPQDISHATKTSRDGGVGDLDRATAASQMTRSPKWKRGSWDLGEYTSLFGCFRK